MMIEEFVDFRVRAGEAVREERQREQARRVGERGRWLRSQRRGRGARPVAATDAAVVSAASAPDTTAHAVDPAPEGMHEERRELADVAR